MKTKIIAIVLGLMLTAMARAQFSGDNQTLTISAETNNWDIPLFVGISNSLDQIQIVNGGVLLEPANYDADIGYDADANRNSVMVSGAGSAWIYGSGQPNEYGNMYIGNAGSSNLVFINNGGAMIPAAYAYIGYNSTSSNNSLVVSGNGSVWNQATSGGMYVGYFGSGNSLTVSGGAEMYADPVTGDQPGANHNRVSVTGAGSVLGITHDWQIGNYGSYNSLVISNGGAIESDRNIEIGADPGSDSNSMVITDSGSVSTNGGFIVGNSGDGNSLVISNGAVVVSNYGTVGATAASNNWVVVTGSGSVWNMTSVNGLEIGDQCFGNSVIVTNGGTVDNSAGYGYISGVSNSVSVTGKGSVWNAGTLGINSTGSAGGNRLTIANGGSVHSSEGNIGTGNHYDPAASSSDYNQAVVTDGGSLWTNSSDINVGDTGSGNSLVISNGGTVITRYLTVGNYTGYNAGSSNNLLMISGGNLMVTNSDGTGSLIVSAVGAGSNSLVFDGGTVTVDTLTAVNGSNSVFTFNSGLLASGGTTMSTATIFAIGDGTNAAMFQMNGGVHSFANDLEIRSNATLSGCGTVNSNVVVDAGGTVLATCDGNLDFTGSVTNNGTMRAINGSTLQAAGPVVNNGTIDVINGAMNFPGGLINHGTVLTARSVMIGQTSILGQSVQVLIPSVLGHTYQLQYSTSLTPANWTNTGVPQAGNGHLLTLTDLGGASRGPACFYRATVTAP